MMRMLRVLAAGTAMFAAASCCESPIAPSAATGGGILQLAVVGNNQLQVGQTSQLQAIATYEDGTQQNVTAIAQWTSNNTAACTVSGKGLVTGVAVGTCVVTAVVRDKTGSRPITIGQNNGPNDPNNPDDPNDPNDPDGPVLGLAVQGAPSVQVGQSTQWQAFAVFSNGAQQNVTGTATWSSGNAAVATVQGGLVAGVSQGATNITASYQGKSAGGPIQVTTGGGPTPTVISLSVTGDTSIAAGESTQWQAIATLNDGSQQNVTSAANWSSGNPSIASVIGGLVTGHASGSSPITAAYGGQTSGQTVQVSASGPGTPDLIGLQLDVPINLSVADLLNGDPIVNLSLKGLYSDGSTQEVTAACVAINCLTFSGNPNLLELDGMGTLELVTLLLQGLVNPNHQINATYGGYTANANVTLQLPVLNSLLFNQSGPVALNLGSNNQLPSLQALFSQGISSDNVVDVLPGSSFNFTLADGLLTQLGGVPIIGPLLIGPLTTEINNLLSQLDVENGVLTGPVSLLNSILNNDLLEALGLNVLPIDLRATASGVTSAPLRINLGN